jgi:glutathione S-transferase
LERLARPALHGVVVLAKRAAKEGFTDERVRESTRKFRAEFERMDKRLAREPYLMGETLTVLDIAWLIYAHRLSLAGYPFERLHPHISAWKERLAARPEFDKEIGLLRHSKEQLEVTRRAQMAAGRTFESAYGILAVRSTLGEET